jgi:hypothetical protein
MKIFYHCYGSAHSSVTAANLHLGLLPRARRPPLAEILHQPLFDRALHCDVGRPILMGADEWGHEVFVIGLAAGKKPLAGALADFAALHGVGRHQLLMVDALGAAGWTLRVGGYLSRRIGLVRLGRPLSAAGVWANYWAFVAIVETVLDRAARGR